MRKIEKQSFQTRKDAWKGRRTRNDNATYADAKIADRQVENALSTYGVVHTYEVSFTSSTRYKWKGLAYSIEDVLPGSAGYTLLQGVGHLSHGAQATEDHNYISQIRAEDLYKQIRLNHTKKDAWQGRPVNNEFLTDRRLTAIAHGVVPHGLRITDLNGHLYEDTNEVVFVVSFMDEYKTNESWNVKKASYDTIDYDYVVLEEFKNLSEDEAWDIFQSRDV